MKKAKSEEHNEEIRRYFEEKYLKHSCFDSLEELLEDKTTIQINAPRALIAVELMGAWRGLNDNYERIATLEEVLKFVEERYIANWGKGDLKGCLNKMLKEAKRELSE